MEEVFGSKETTADLEGVRAEIKHFHANKVDGAYVNEHEGEDSRQ